jgi:large subunit ribosomal protein L25
MVVDQQVDPIRGTLLHADLKRIDLTKRIRVTVPVHHRASPRASRCRADARSHHPRD